MPDAPPPQEALLRLMTGPWIAQAIFVAAKLGIADLVGEEPRPSGKLAAASGVDAQSLHRVLRALASVGVFAEDNEGRFELTPMAGYLRSQVPCSLRAYAIMLGEQWHWRCWGEILHSVRTGKTAFEHIFGKSVFEHYAEHPEAARISIEGLASRSAQENAAIRGAYDFSRARTLIDVGGGQGTLLLSLLAREPHLTGILLDRPQVIASAKPLLDRSEHTDRVTAVGGDFFETVPAGGDIYLLKKVLHDWDDARAIAILKVCRAAIGRAGRLLVLEPVIAEGNAPGFAKLLDLLMLVYAGGRERSEAEHRGLLAAA